MPQFVQDALQRDELLFFVGAGVSRSHGAQRGLPTSGELAAMIETNLLGRKATGSGDLVRLSQEVVWADRGSRHRLHQFLRAQFADPSLEPLPAHFALAMLGAPIITTNYDELIERASGQVGASHTAIWTDSQMPSSTNSVLLKVHGSISQPESCIITEDDYHDWLARDPDLRNLVRALLVTRTVCFVGYSLNDPNFRSLVRELRKRFGALRRPSLFVAFSLDEESYDHRYLKYSLGLNVIESDATDFLESLVRISTRGPLEDVETSPRVRQAYFRSASTLPFIEYCASTIIDAIESRQMFPYSMSTDVWSRVRETVTAGNSDTESDHPTPPWNGFVYIDEGPFIAGGARHGNELIRVEETRQPFWLSATPVTNSQYREFVSWVAQHGHSGDYCHPNEPPGKDHTPQPDGGVPHVDFVWDDQDPQLPVVLVDWWDAYACAKWMGCRLPTDLEWERAARGRFGRVFPWGDQFDARFANTSESGQGHAVRVDSYLEGASPAGALQMAGNVWEWCMDEYFGVERAPSAARVVRGGSYTRDSSRARSAFRNGRPPGDRWVARGFRLARNTEEDA